MGEFQIADGMIRDFALQLLRRLQTPRPVDKPPGDAAAIAGTDSMEDGPGLIGSSQHMAKWTSAFKRLSKT